MIDSYDQSMFDVAAKTTEYFSNTNKEVQQIKKYIRIGREMRLNAQIGDYDMDEFILDLGSEVNVLTNRLGNLWQNPSRDILQFS